MLLCVLHSTRAGCTCLLSEGCRAPGTQVMDLKDPEYRFFSNPAAAYTPPEGARGRIWKIQEW